MKNSTKLVLAIGCVFAVSGCSTMAHVVGQSSGFAVTEEQKAKRKADRIERQKRRELIESHVHECSCEKVRNSAKNALVTEGYDVQPDDEGTMTTYWEYVSAEYDDEGDLERHPYETRYMVRFESPEKGKCRTLAFFQKKMEGETDTERDLSVEAAIIEDNNPEARKAIDRKAKKAHDEYMAKYRKEKEKEEKKGAKSESEDEEKSKES